LRRSERILLEMQSEHPRFMKVFAEWMRKLPGAVLANRNLKAERLFATAYEFVIIGAYAHSNPTP
jgi:hypothetical protein